MWRLVWIALLVFGGADTVWCQPPRGHGDGGGPRSRIVFFQALRDAYQESSNKEFVDLLHHRPVRDEIELEEADYEALRDIGKQAMHAVRDLEHDKSTHRLSREEIRGKIIEVIGPIQQRSLELLKSKARFDRLVELIAQRHGYAAAANKEVADRIGLSGEDLDRFRETRDGLKRELMEETGRQIERIFKQSGGDVRERIQTVFENSRTWMDDRLAGELTVEQQNAFARLLEESFTDFPPMRGGWRRGPPPRRDGHHHPDREGPRSGPPPPKAGDPNCCNLPAQAL